MTYSFTSTKPLKLIKCNSCISPFLLKGSEHDFPKHAALADYFKLKALGNSRYRKGSVTSPFYLKAGREISPKKGAFPVPGGEEHSYHQRLEIDVEMDLYKHTS